MFALSVVFLQCREILPFPPPGVNGSYGISGLVTSENGAPLDSIAVWLTYTLVRVDFRPMDTSQIFVNTRSVIYRVDVFNLHGLPVRNLFYGYPAHGVFPLYSWDSKDSNGNYVASGKYLIKYQQDSTIIKIDPYLASGLLTTITDRNGYFSLGDDNLPIGELFDRYSSDGTFEGVFQVTSDVNLLLTHGLLRGQFTVPLQLNNVYHGNFILR
ncbi:MAG: hypothetical protein ACHQQQ_02995 [Bacteroidota bacterium]